MMAGRKARRPPRLWLITIVLVLILSGIVAWIAIPGANLPHRIDPQGIAMVWVPPGCFLMGSNSAKDPQARPEEQPQHRVCITQGYWIDQYDVTNAAFDVFVKAGGYHTDAYWSADGLKWKRSKNITGPETGCTAYSSEDQQPRVCVNYYEAQAYATWRGGRLPTEAEWEYAARGPLAWIYPWGNAFDKSRANTSEAGPHKITNVGSYPDGKSWVGAQDMAGNVWQWVADWYDERDYQPMLKHDPSGPTIGTDRVFRGGSWYGPQSFARSAFRNYDLPDDSNGSSGFRVVVSVPSV